ncbi:MAG: hypothetical protein CM15mP23_23300 [Cryomorphaceae bacterium]|nr:MAG: hypothetical protein CM15mP23_23300 [Cryomorphaceae bacterium]
MQMSLCEMIHLKSYDISHKVTISSAIENAKNLVQKIVLHLLMVFLIQFIRNYN